ncbi:DUF3106 domain-containing protein [Massilia niastensis]|uniref:DUF3106 domain-containing protein n=1 Tax=Massilia niastensis TaxID=544911 RepID=UPI00037489D1|nr:DUF3106 domain-containing protein [Massilia niastensis]
MTKNASKPRVALLGTAAAVLVAGAIAWVIVDRTGTPSPATPASTAAAGAKPVPKTLDKPLWRDLTRAQQQALAPLQTEWDQMDGLRKRRWLEVSQRFASMNTAEQQRVHERMRQWMKLTPEQRNLARENFNRARNLAPGEKAATWENYKQLPEEQRRKLAKSAARKSAPVALPESPALVTPTSCPPNTTRRGASCIGIQAPGMPAPPAPATAATPAPGAALPVPAVGAPGSAPATALPGAAAPGAAAPGAVAPGAAPQGAAAPAVAPASPPAPQPSAQAAPNASN